MEITIIIERFEAGVVVTYNGDAHELEINEDNSRHSIDLEIELDEDEIQNHLESIYGPIYKEGEEDKIVEHLEDEGYFVANSIDEAVKRVKDWLKFNKEEMLADAEEKFIEDGKWLVDPDEIDEVDTFEFVSDALNKKGFYILKIPSFLRGFLGGAK